MLTTLRLAGIGTLDDATVEFAPGFTALTGETGAGKTMVVTGLDLLLGGRLDRARLARGGSLVEGRLTVDPADTALAARLEELGARVEDEELLLVRRITPDGRSRCSAGGTSVPVAVLAELTSDRVAIHGQMDQVRLRGTDAQRTALDAFAGGDAGALLSELGAAWDDRAAVRAELADLETRLDRRDARLAELRAALDALEEAAARPGEREELTGSAERLGHVTALRDASAFASSALTADEEPPGALSVLAQAQRALDAETGHDPALAELASALQAAHLELEDLASRLVAYEDGLDADPGALAAVHERIALLDALVRDHGPALGGATDLDGLLAASSDGARELTALEDSDATVAGLTERIERLDAEVARIARDLSALRRAAAERLGEAVTAELGALLMPKARVTVAVEDGPETRTGADRIGFLLRPHPGSDPVPVARGASGGELSRVMLALETALAGGDADPSGERAPAAPAGRTFVFDEIDAGVGGAAGVAVGRRLARLAETAQVVVVTHLAQVASHADHHVRVTKSSDETSTRSELVALDAGAREEEVARMLTGSDSSDGARAGARELLDDAAATSRTTGTTTGAPAASRP